MGLAVVVTRRWTPQHPTAFLPATGFSGFPSSPPLRSEKSQNTDIKKKASENLSPLLRNSLYTSIVVGVCYESRKRRNPNSLYLSLSLSAPLCGAITDKFSEIAFAEREIELLLSISFLGFYRKWRFLGFRTVWLRCSLSFLLLFCLPFRLILRLRLWLRLLRLPAMEQQLTKGSHTR
ncbi:hypothetical protein HYC85_022727 [Camellia sinensis]|uniref:Uncharacterized protein n=1 Tax=Camellia sinensis TaxID=4442 RepID=A0A7J7GGD5_CAMSI|nr:hypothetical protein HYC85_022727 [Camellia sinensis]